MAKMETAFAHAKNPFLIESELSYYGGICKMAPPAIFSKSLFPTIRGIVRLVPVPFVPQERKFHHFCRIAFRPITSRFSISPPYRRRRRRP